MIIPKNLEVIKFALSEQILALINTNRTDREIHFKVLTICQKVTERAAIDLSKVSFTEV